MTAATALRQTMPDRDFIHGQGRMKKRSMGRSDCCAIESNLERL